ncbi:MAG: C1 family peptidase [Chloroflexota bacterium]
MKNIFRIAVFSIFFLVIGLFPQQGKSSTVSAEGNTGDWQAIIELSPDQTKFASENLNSLSSSMQIQSVSRSLSGNDLNLSGSQGVDQLRSALFDDAAAFADFLGGPVDLTIIIPAGYGPVTLELEARLSAGYEWNVIPGNQVGMAEAGSSTFQTRYKGFGAPSIQTMHLSNTGTSDQQVHLIYRRSFEADQPIHAYLSLNASNFGNVITISDPTPKSPEPSAATSQSIDALSTLDNLQAMALPTSFDWRTQGVVPPVRNQGGCGSCWAFGTVAVMESAVKIGGGPLTDLSEQFLLSCNNSGWSCNGGLTASMYHTTSLAKSQSSIGAVLESDKPYTATNGTCSISLPHPYKASNWQFIVASEFTMPTVDQIKTAIYTYGPITAGVCAGSGWNTYTGGVFSTDETSQCGGSTNHQIVLVGWDDSTQTWILRNSWGSGWGNGGYMNIKWGVSRVGEGTSWIKYINSSVTSTPTKTASPTYTPSQTATRTPTYTPSQTPTKTATYTPTSSKTPTFTATPSNTPVPGATLTFTNTPSKTPVFTSTTVPTSITATLPPTQTVISITSLSPTGNTYSTKPTFTWVMNKAVSFYRLKVTDPSFGTSPINNVVITNSRCNTFTSRCFYTPGNNLSLNHTYTWQVAAGNGPYNTVTTFRTLPGFNSQFNGSAQGWAAGPGAEWILSKKDISTFGYSYSVSSESYAQNFENFTFQARLKRISTTGFSTGLIIRGEPSFDSQNDWLTSYQFLYRQDGTFSVWRGINGDWVAIQPWTYSTSIKSNNWNILKVVADADQFQFFINNILVWTGQDSSLASGQVGVWMYRENVTEKVYVDWATLGMSEIYKAVRTSDSNMRTMPVQLDRFGKTIP